MKRVIAVTGPPGSGKTTVVSEVANRLSSSGTPVKGFVTLEVREGGERKGFDLVLIETNEHIPMARVGWQGPRVGKYGVDVAAIDEASKRLLSWLDKASVIIVDEVGPMELLSEEFRRAIPRVLSEAKAAVMTVHYRARHELVERVKREAFKLILVERCRSGVAVEEVIKAVSEIYK